MSINDSMTALADEIREISGETQFLGIDDMREEIAQANDEVDIQANLINQLISMANNLPEAGSGDGPSLPVLTNEGTYADLLQGKQLIDGSGGIVVGTIPTKTQNDLTANGATVTVPSGYYASQTTKSVATATRGATTISVTADDTNDKLTVTGSNTQAAGYVTDTAAKTASTTITLTASGATVTATETGGKKVSKSVASGSATTPNRTITLRPLISVDNTGEIKLAGSVTDTFAPTVSAGYVSSGVAGTITVTAEGTKQLTTQAEKTVTPTKSSQTAVARGVYTTGVVTVGPIPSQYIIPSGTKEVTENGTYDVTQYEDVHVVITPDELELQEKIVTPTTGQQVVTADSGYDALIKVTVNPIPSNYIVPSGTKNITSNGTHDVKTYESVSVAVPDRELVLQDKTVTPGTSQQTVTADNNYDALGSVTVNAMPTATQAMPTISVNSSGLITASATQSAGYVAAGTKSATQQLTTQVATTYTPTTTDQTINAQTYLIGEQIIKGDANLVASNIKSGISIFGVDGTLEEGGGGGEDSTEIEDAMVTDSIVDYTNSRVKTIGRGAFAFASSLKTAAFPNVSRVYSSAFYQSPGITSVDLPMCGQISGYAFASCSKLVDINLPVCTSISGYAFQYCTSLPKIIIPNCATISAYAFFVCYSLSTVDCAATLISTGAFASCRRLQSLYLRGSTICSLANSSVFVSTPFRGLSTYFSGTPYIYVPASLVDAYKTATNWTYFSEYIVAIEDN